MPENTAPQGQAGEVTPNWHDGIHEDFKADPSIKTFVETEDGLNKFVESHLNLRKKMGTAVWVPGENPTDDEVSDFRKKLGIPESPDKYEVKYKEHEHIKIDDALDKEWKGLAHKIGLTPKQAQELADYEFDRMERFLTSSMKNYEAAADALKKEFGNGFQDVLDRANTALKNLAPDQTTFDAFTNPDGPYANDPFIIKLLANAGAHMGEHAFREGDPKTINDTKEELKKQMLDQQLIYMDQTKDMEVRKRANKEYQRLAELVYGNAEVSGSGNVKL